MSSVVPMKRPPEAPETAAEWVEKIWLAYPAPGRARSSKARCRAKLLAITAPGGGALKSREPETGELMELHYEATFQEIYDGVVRYEKSVRNPGLGEYGYKDGGQYIPMFEKWLNRGGWET